MSKIALFIGSEKQFKKIKNEVPEEYTVILVKNIDDIINILETKKVSLILISIDVENINLTKIIEFLRLRKNMKYLPIVFLNEEMELGDIFGKKKIERMLNEKTEMIENLQDVMFMSIAELVECRDENTGGHIKRTAKYVELLVKELVKKGIYKETLTPRYVKDMIRSAPLHDLGKIGIDDKTLLKNGMLNEEEFEFMKTHSALGGKTIQKMIDQTTEGSFLDVAKDMANYHHEKWNGCGYPEGLKGEEIPISARVMAIADVYDALTTKRPYKEPFSHEQTVEIILNGKGTAFDPVIVDIFKEIHLEFEKIKNNIY